MRGIDASLEQERTFGRAPLWLELFQHSEAYTRALKKIPPEVTLLTGLCARAGKIPPPGIEIAPRNCDTGKNDSWKTAIPLSTMGDAARHCSSEDHVKTDFTWCGKSLCTDQYSLTLEKQTAVRVCSREREPLPQSRIQVRRTRRLAPGNNHRFQVIKLIRFWGEK